MDAADNVVAEEIAVQPGAEGDAVIAAAQLMADERQETDASASEAEAEKSGESQREKEEEKQPTESRQTRAGLSRAWRAVRKAEAKISAAEEIFKQQTQALADYTQLRGYAEKRDYRAIMSALGIDPTELYKAETERLRAELTGETDRPDPTATRALDELRALREEIAQRDQRAHRARAEEGFLSQLTSDNHPDLQIFFDEFGRDTLINEAIDVGQQMAREIGRYPTDRELLAELDARASVLYERRYNRLNQRYGGAKNQPTSRRAQVQSTAKPGNDKQTIQTAAQESSGAKRPKTDEELLEAAALIARHGFAEQRKSR